MRLRCDGGNGNVIDEEANIHFPGGASLVKVQIEQRATTLETELRAPLFELYPNPFAEKLQLQFEQAEGEIEIWGLAGQQIWAGKAMTHLSISTRHWPKPRESIFCDGQGTTS